MTSPGDDAAGVADGPLERIEQVLSEFAADAEAARDADALEDARARVEAGLNAVTREADRLSGRPPVEPADEPWRASP